jgi:hypothetical protein
MLWTKTHFYFITVRWYEIRSVTSNRAFYVWQQVGSKLGGENLIHEVHKMGCKKTRYGLLKFQINVSGTYGVATQRKKKNYE